MNTHTDSSLKAIGTRLRDLGYTWNEITEILYGHGGNQSYYTVNGHQKPVVSTPKAPAHPGYFVLG